MAYAQAITGVVLCLDHGINEDGYRHVDACEQREGLLDLARIEAIRERMYAMQNIDRNGPIPIYHQIAMRLEQQIAMGKYPIDSQIPSERTLASTYGTSRTTMRQALSVLEKSGILERRRPDGTFVREKPAKLSPTLSIPVSFVRSMVESGQNVQVDLLSVKSLIPHDTTVTTSLGLHHDQPVTKFVRLIQSESSPIAYVEAFIPLTLFPDVGEKSLPGNSMHEMLFHNYGTIISEADHSIECAPATPTTADWLKLEANTAILKLESCYYDQYDRAVEFVYTHWRADVMKLRMRTTLEPQYKGDIAD